MQSCTNCNESVLDENSRTLFTTKYWVVSLHADQRAAGRVNIVSKRHIAEPGELGLAEKRELIKACEKVNYLFNDLFRTKHIEFEPAAGADHATFIMAPSHLYRLSIGRPLQVDKTARYQPIECTPEQLAVLRDQMVCKMIKRGYVDSRSIESTWKSPDVKQAIYEADKRAFIILSIFALHNVLIMAQVQRSRL